MGNLICTLKTTDRKEITIHFARPFPIGVSSERIMEEIPAIARIFVRAVTSVTPLNSVKSVSFEHDVIPDNFLSSDADAIIESLLEIEVMSLIQNEGVRNQEVVDSNNENATYNAEQDVDNIPVKQETTSAPTITIEGDWALLLVDIKTGQLIEVAVCALESMPLEVVIENYLEQGFDTICKQRA